MSTYWGYRCETCPADSETWYNHGDADLAEIYQKRHALLRAVDALESINWRVDMTFQDSRALSRCHHE